MCDTHCISWIGHVIESANPDANLGDKLYIPIMCITRMKG